MDTIIDTARSYGSYLVSEILLTAEPWYINYFWFIVLWSLLVWAAEIRWPWRRDQAIIRRDFWLDAFYMIFNFFIFKLVFFSWFSAITEHRFLEITGLKPDTFALFDWQEMPTIAGWLSFFVLLDFLQWLTHIALHRIPFLWPFHQIHHSVVQMGFAAHMRFHWMENIIYTPVKYLGVMLLGGFTPEHVFLAYYLAIAVGHLNHANLKLTYGPLKYLLNNPVMHLWHHAYELPPSRPYGINFGISLSIWDYLFNTASIPHEDGRIKLGYPGMEKTPTTFLRQQFHGFYR